MAVLFFVLAALACTAHCKPSGDPGVVLKKSSEASANAGDHESKLSPPWIKEMEGYEEDINEVLEVLWPFLNLLFGSDSNDSSNEDAKESAEDIYSDEMFVRWIPDDDNSNNFSDDDFDDDFISNTRDDSIDLSATDSYVNSKDHSMDDSDDYIHDDESRENLIKYFDEHSVYDSFEELKKSIAARIMPEYSDHDSSDYLKYDPNDNTNQNMYIHAGVNYDDKIFAQWMTEDDVSNDDSTDDFIGGIDYHFVDKYYVNSEDAVNEEIYVQRKSENPLIRPETPKINHLPTSTDSSKLVFILVILNPNLTSLTKCTENSDKFPLPTTTELSADTYLPEINSKDSAFQSTTHSLEETTLPTTTENSEDVIFSTNIGNSKVTALASTTEDSIYTSYMTTEIVKTLGTNTDSSIETINTSESTTQVSTNARYKPTETVPTEAVNTLIPVMEDMFTIHYIKTEMVDFDYITTEMVDFEFGFDTSDGEDSDDSCYDEMIIQLVPDDSSETSSTTKGSENANPEPVPTEAQAKVNNIDKTN